MRIPGRRPAAVLLDFDGLVCDTERAAQRAWRELYHRLGHDFPTRVWADMCGRSDGEDIATADLGRRLGRPLRPEERSWRRHRKDELSDQEPLRPGVANLVASASALATPVAVVSSSSRAWVHRHLRRVGLLDRLAAIVTGEDTPRHKPAPDLYLLALARLGVAGEAAVAFEDSGTGVRSAVAAGICCVAVPSAVGDRAGLGAARLVLDDLRGFDLRGIDLDTLDLDECERGGRSC